MSSKIQKRAIAIIIITLAGLYIVLMPHDRLPNGRDFASFTQFKANLQKNISLGLDLRGGSHLVMQVQTDQVIQGYTDKNVDQAKGIFQQKGWQFNDIKRTGADQITITVPDRTHDSDIVDELDREFNSLMPSGQGWKASEVGNTIVFSLDKNEQNELRERATDQALQIIENRVNAFGVTEPTIQRQGGAGQYQILLEMPGIDDPDRVKSTLNADSNLELKPVAKGTQIPYPTKDAAETAEKALPGGADNYEVLPYSEKGREGFAILEKTPIVTGLDMRDASALSSQYGGDNYQISFSLTKGGASRFGTWTGAHVHDFLAIVLNNEVKSAPEIQSQISDKGEITGSFTKQSAEDLALVLRSGALPAKVVYLEEKTVGPSLGADSIKSGVTASVVGLLAVMLFMLWYYRLSGVNAVLALFLNLILLLAALVVFGATLTLPGIAGVILTIGMAVDSNVLIFERIREEMRNGKTVASSVDLGFGKAFLTIIDTHVTTIVSAVFLFVFGTGPIRGFAVTLVAGLLANLFTAVFVSRTIFMWHLNRSARVETLSI
ncbi:MAG TPA: protein translocase subunit SecD [Blastocatellia bacterium]|nr:protein translocase subunit SecD [Blastocatellia bacterium]